jgi:hypothetical protein
MRDGSPPQMRRKSSGNAQASEREPGEADAQAFARLFDDAYRKCFSIPFAAPLTESESHRFSVEIAESAGLEIGWKSLKNYSSYLLGSGGRTENPSVPTLDTLARYVADAPRTTEERRRTQERHYPYWFRYRDALRQTEMAQTSAPPDETRATTDEASETRPTPARVRPPILLLVAAMLAAAFASWLALQYAGPSNGGSAERFIDEFDDVSEAALTKRGWSVQAVDSAHWTRRHAKPGHLTLFTLPGDNWPQPGRAPVIRNLLVRRLPSQCFIAELRLTSFVPRQNWQQAGILLLEDTAFAGRSVRTSIGFNDFAGGFPETKEIIVQAITSLGRESSKPEEVVHHRLFVEEPGTAQLVRQNLEHSALRIEKHGAQLRFLSSTGAMKNAAFREVGRAEFDFRPAYVAVFALEGFVTRSDDAPAHVDAFTLSEVPCAR